MNNSIVFVKVELKIALRSQVVVAGLIVHIRSAV